MSDPTVDPVHAQMLSEFTDLLNRCGPESAEVQMFIATCNDPELVTLYRTAMNVQRYLRENMVLVPGEGSRR